MQAVKFGISVTLLTMGCAGFGFAQENGSSDAAFKAQSSSVQHAVASAPMGGAAAQQGGQVRQVVGKQPETPARRSGRGLLGSIFGTRSNEASPQTSTQSSGSSSAGLLSRFGGGGHSSDGDDDGRRVIEPAPRTEEPDWSGVPFHSPKHVSSAKNSRPITDPNDPSNRNKSLVGQAAAGTSQTAQTTKPATKPLNSQIPVPPAENNYTRSSGTANTAAPRVASRPVSEVQSSTKSTNSTASSTVPNAELNTSTYQPLSGTDSSRRSRRRTVSPLEVELQTNSESNVVATDEVAAPVAPLHSSNYESSSYKENLAAEEQPRVNRKPMPRSSSPTPAQTVSTSQTVAPPTGNAVPADNSSMAPANSASNPTTYPNASASSSRRNSMPTTLQRSTESTAALTIDSNQNTTELAASASARPAAESWQSAGSNQSNSPSSQAGTNQATNNVEPQTTANDPSQAGDAAQANRALVNLPNDKQSIPSSQQPSSGNQGSSLGVTPNTTSQASAKPAETAIVVNKDANNVVGEIPGLRVITMGPADIPVRQSVAYKIQIENMSNIDAPGAMVQVKLPSWVAIQSFQPTRGEVGREDDAATRHLLWMVDGLPAGTREEIVLNLSATEAKAFDVNTEWAVIPKSLSARVTVREPKLDLIIEGPDQVVFGESQTYKVRVLNPGTGPSDSVVFTLSPNSATPQSQRIGSIPAGQEAQFEVELTARDMENLQIHGLASGEFNLKAEKIKNIQVIRAQLEAVVTGPLVKYQDSEATYNLQLTNNGFASSKNITAMLRLPVGCQYLGGIQGAQANGNQLTWTVEELAAAGTVEYTFTCKMSQTGQQTFDFACEGSALGKATVDFVTQVDALADLVLSINDPPAPAPVGQEVVYEIVIRNRGSRVAEQVNVLAQFGEDIEPIRIEGAEGEVIPGQVKFTAIPKIDAGQEIVLKVFAKAEREGHHRFCTEVSCGETLLITEEATRYMEMVGTRVSRRSGDSKQE